MMFLFQICLKRYFGRPAAVKRFINAKAARKYLFLRLTVTMMKFKVYDVNFLLLVLFICFEVKGQEEECFLTSGGKGVCKFLSECKSAKEILIRGEFPKDICTFEGTQAIVCCDVNSETEAPVTQSPPNITPRGGSVDESKANEMCKFYSKYAYQTVELPTLSLTVDDKRKFTDVLECHISTQPLIIGGTVAARKEFPHMVHIGYVSKSQISWDCGGSLISENFVLTAAHCLKRSFGGDAKFVRGGITNQTDTQNLQIRNIIERIPYPDYTTEAYHDIALIKVDRNFDLNTFLRPACLFIQPTFSGLHTIATGWGLREFAGGQPSQDLYKVVLEVFSTEQCNNTYRRLITQPGSKLYAGINEDLMVCAGSSQDIRDACNGDSGGPLQTIHENTQDIKCMYNIIGVTSFGDGCGLAINRPGVYTRVSHYVKWIEEIVWN